MDKFCASLYTFDRLHVTRSHCIVIIDDYGSIVNSYRDRTCMRSSKDKIGKCVTWTNANVKAHIYQRWTDREESVEEEVKLGLHIPPKFVTSHATEEDNYRIRLCVQ